MTRTVRKLTGWISIVVIVFAQLALSAYACPMEQVAASAQVQAQNAEPGCCPDRANASAGLCHEHCKDSKVVSGDAQPVPLVFMASFVLSLPVLRDASPSGPGLPSQYFQRPSPPLTVLHCCFRI